MYVLAVYIIGKMGILQTPVVLHSSASYLNSNIYDFPNRPHAIFSTLQGTQNPGTNPTLQSDKNANAQPIHPC